MAGTVSQTDEIIILGTYDDWYLVAFGDDQTGYISGDLLAVPEDAEIAIAPTVTFTPTNTFTPTRTPTLTLTPTPTQTFTLTPTATKPFGSLDNPFPAGEWLPYENVDIRATQIVRHANNRVNGMNMFNEPAPAGSEYVLVYFEVRCKEQTCNMSGSGFRLIDSQGREWEEPSAFLVLEPDLDNLEAIEGGVMQGWQAFMFPPEETITAIYVRYGGGILGGGDELYTLPPRH